jgi:hypothetical protein
MEPMLYDTLRKKIQSLSTDAIRIHLGPEITPARMKRYIIRIARELKTPVTVRRVPGGLLFWRSSEEDAQQATEVGARLQKARTREPSPEVASRVPTAQPRGKTAPQQPSRKRTTPRR